MPSTSRQASRPRQPKTIPECCLSSVQIEDDVLFTTYLCSPSSSPGVRGSDSDKERNNHGINSAPLATDVPIASPAKVSSTRATRIKLRVHPPKGTDVAYSPELETPVSMKGRDCSSTNSNTGIRLRLRLNPPKAGMSKRAKGSKSTIYDADPAGRGSNQFPNRKRAARKADTCSEAGRKDTGSRS
jgi:hypothetical protein